MSWMDYVNNLMATRTMSHVGFFSHDGTSWATTPDCPINASAVKNIVFSIDQSDSFDGVMIGNDKYIVINKDVKSHVVYKKGGNGVVAVKTKQCVIIAMHDPSVKSEVTLGPVAKMQKHLLALNY
jgi:hypothetical protein